MSFLTWTPYQWVSFGVFVINSGAMASFWQGWVEPTMSVTISGALVYVCGILIYMQTGAPPPPK